MERFSCPDHGLLVVKLAQGRLDDPGSLEAEQLLLTCPSCSGWWERTLGEPALAPLDAAVAAGLARFEAPRRTARRWWLTAAAAAIVTLGVGALWWQHATVPPDVTAESVAAPVRSPDDVLSRWSFEEGTIAVAEVVVAPEPPSRQQAVPAAVETSGPVVQGGFESGDLSGWSSHT